MRPTLVTTGARCKRSGVRAINPAWITLGATLALAALGVYAIDLGAETRAHTLVEIPGLALKQAILIGVGLLAAAVVAFPNYRLIRSVAWAALALSVVPLIFLLLPFVPESIVTPRNGTRGWINLGFTDVQPAEPAKIAFVLACAHYLRYRSGHRRLLGLIAPALIALVPMALITLQPDLGTASLFGPSLLAMLLAAGARLRHIALVLLLAGLLGAASFPVLKPHQKTRFIALMRQFQGDQRTASDINYQSFTAQTLIGAGGPRGMDDQRTRTLVRFNRLPERHNDMIVAVVVARYGFVGGLAVISLYLLWVGSAVLVAAQCQDPFGRLLVVGLSAFVATQAVVNIGMNVGLLPIVGVTLPFVSAGGSSMVTGWVMVGLILNVGLRRAVPPLRPGFEFDDADPRP